jgi:hypothetical protein
MRTLILFLLSVLSSRAALTVTLTSLTANSPNSLSATMTVTGGSFGSVQIACGTTNGSAYTVSITPWVDASVSPQTLIIAQLAPRTTYFCIANAAISTGGGGGTTASAQATTATMDSRGSVPVSIGLGAGCTEGYTCSYNNANFPTSYTTGDSMIPICLTNGTCVINGNDGTGVSGAYNSNLFFMGINSSFALTSLNQMTSFGAASAASCTQAGYTWKGAFPHAEGNTLIAGVYCQNADWKDFSFMQSDDAAVTWYNPAHNSGSANANGDAPTTGVAGSVEVSGQTNLGVSAVWVECIGANGFKGGVCDNPVDGLDAYAYWIAGKGASGSNLAFFRVYKRSNFQVAANIEAYVGSATTPDVNTAANWSTTIASATTVMNSAATSAACSGPFVRWFSDFNRYIITCGLNIASDTSQRFKFLQSSSLLGWLAVAPTYTEPSPPLPNNATWTNNPEGWQRQYIAPLPTSYALDANGKSATVKYVYGGSFLHTNNSDQAHNQYSLAYTPVTIEAMPVTKNAQPRYTSQLRLSWNHEPNAYYAKGLDNSLSQVWDMYTHIGNTIYPFNSSGGISFWNVLSPTIGCAMTSITNAALTASGLSFNSSNTTSTCKTSVNSGITGDPTYTIIEVINSSDLTRFEPPWAVGVATTAHDLSAGLIQTGAMYLSNDTPFQISANSTFTANNYYCIAATHVTGAMTTSNTFMQKTQTRLAPASSGAGTPNVTNAVTWIGGSPETTSAQFRGNIVFVAYHHGVALTQTEIGSNCGYLKKNLLAIRGITVTP